MEYKPQGGFETTEKVIIEYVKFSTKFNVTQYLCMQLRHMPITSRTGLQIQ